MSEKVAPDWERIEADYRANVLSLREIAEPHGITEGAVRKRAKRDGWTRDLAAKIQAKADELVRKAEVRNSVRANQEATERQIIEANAERIAQVKGEHRADIGRARELVKKLLAELEQQTDNMGTFEQLLDALADVDEADDGKAPDRRKRLLEQWQRAMSLGGRADTLKKLADTLRVLVDKEREAYGMESSGEQPPEDGPRRSFTDAELAVRLGRLLKTKPEVAAAIPALANHRAPRALQ